MCGQKSRHKFKKISSCRQRMNEQIDKDFIATSDGQ